MTEIMTELPNKLYSGNHGPQKRRTIHGILGAEIDLESEMGTAGLKHSWRNMEAAAEDRTGWRKVVCGLCCTDSDKALVK